MRTLPYQNGCAPQRGAKEISDLGIRNLYDAVESVGISVGSVHEHLGQAVVQFKLVRPEAVAARGDPQSNHAIRTGNAAQAGVGCAIDTYTGKSAWPTPAWDSAMMVTWL